MSNHSFTNKDNKQCFCIDATEQNIPYILDNLNIQLAERQLINPVANEPTPVDDPYEYLLTPNIHDVINVDPKKEKILKTINDVMENALLELQKPKDIVLAANEKVDIGPRDSMTIERHTDIVATPSQIDTVDSDDIIVDLNKMARTTNKRQRKAGNLNLFEDFNCDTQCSRTHTVRKGLFDMDETKYILLIAALLFLCSIVMRK